MSPFEHADVDAVVLAQQQLSGTRADDAAGRSNSSGVHQAERLAREPPASGRATPATGAASDGRRSLFRRGGSLGLRLRARPAGPRAARGLLGVTFRISFGVIQMRSPGKMRCGFTIAWLSLPDRRPHPGRAEIGVGDVPERVARRDDVDAALVALRVVADGAEVRLLGRGAASADGGFRRAPSVSPSRPRAGSPRARRSRSLGAQSLASCGAAGSVRIGGRAPRPAPPAREPARRPAPRLASCAVAAPRPAPGWWPALRRQQERCRPVSANSAAARLTSFEIFIASPQAAGPPFAAAPTAPWQETDGRRRPPAGRTKPPAVSAGGRKLLMAAGSPGGPRGLRPWH